MKLIYFDIPGKAEAIRLCAAVGKVTMEDVRITRDEFAAMKESGRLPFGQVPSLEVDGQVLAQSSAILRYVATMGGLHPANDALAAAQINSLVSEEEDMFCGVSVSRYGPRFGFDLTDEYRAEVRAKLNAEVLPKHLSFLEKKLAASKTGWLAGTEKPSIADFVFVPRLQWLVSGANDGIDGGNLLDGYPKVKEMMAKLMALPEVVEYYEKHPPAA